MFINRDLFLFESSNALRAESLVFKCQRVEESNFSINTFLYSVLYVVVVYSSLIRESLNETPLRLP